MLVLQRTATKLQGSHLEFMFEAGEERGRGGYKEWETGVKSQEAGFNYWSTAELNECIIQSRLMLHSWKVRCSEQMHI